MPAALGCQPRTHLNCPGAVIDHPVLGSELRPGVQQSHIEFILENFSCRDGVGRRQVSEDTCACLSGESSGGQAIWGAVSPILPTPNVFPRPTVCSFTDHFWNSCLNMADSAPSLMVSTLVLPG